LVLTGEAQKSVSKLRLARVAAIEQSRIPPMEIVEHWQTVQVLTIARQSATTAQ